MQCGRNVISFYSSSRYIQNANTQDYERARFKLRHSFYSDGVQKEIYSTYFV